MESLPRFCVLFITTNSFEIQPIMLRWYNMPPRRKKQPPISVEWAESLIGLSMWWVGCNGHNLHDGKIVSFDISRQKWNLLLDARDEDLPYLMAYLSCLYVRE
jgi:hypothetical protein